VEVETAPEAFPGAGPEGSMKNSEKTWRVRRKGAET